MRHGNLNILESDPKPLSKSHTVSGNLCPRQSRGEHRSKGEGYVSRPGDWVHVRTPDGGRRGGGGSGGRRSRRDSFPRSVQALLIVVNSVGEFFLVVSKARDDGSKAWNSGLGLACSRFPASGHIRPWRAAPYRGKIPRLRIRPPRAKRRARSPFVAWRGSRGRAEETREVHSPEPPVAGPQNAAPPAKE